MISVPLADFACPAGSRAGAETSLPVYSVTKHSGFVPSLEYFKKQVFSRDVSGYKLVEPGDFAYATIHLDEGSIGVAPERGLISPMYTVFRVDPSRVDSRYLIRFLKSPRALAHYSQLGKGAIHRRKSISLAALGALPVPLPSLDQQVRIAAILDHTDVLRIKRRQVLAHLDSLTQSLFRAMFDGTRTGERLGDIADLFGGASLPEAEKFCDQPGGVLLMKVSDMNAEGNEDEIGATALWTSAPTPRSATVGAGAVILPKRGASIATNKKRLTTRVTCLDPNLMGVQPLTNKVTSRYLHEWFKSFDLSTITSGSTVPQLNKQDLEPLVVPLPGLVLQETFSERSEQINAGRAAARRALAAADELFASVQSRAFRGEL